MKKIIFCFFFHLILYCNSIAQVSLSLQEPPAGIVQRSQLWNFALIYSGTLPIEVSVVMTLTDPATNQIVLSGATRPITLVKGVKTINASEPGLVSYSYSSSVMGNLSGSLLPVGVYQACYVVYGSNKDIDGVLSEDCLTVEVQPLAPPQLAMPGDSSNLNTAIPQFSWLPPTPASLFTDLNYNLLLVEVRSDQSASEAIQENVPIYFGRNIRSVSINYPASNKSLDTAKLYAWQVIARNSETPAAVSEVWTFRIAGTKPEKISTEGKLHLELGAPNGIPETFELHSRNLSVKYYSFDPSRVSKILFYDENGKVHKSTKRTVNYGDNYLEFELDRSFRSNVNYTIEISDTFNRRYKVSFFIDEN